MAIVRDAAAGRRAVERGANAVQLRDPGAAARALEREAALLVRTVAPVPVVVSARADVALAAGAAGVHLPERDLPVAAGRRLLGPDALVGRSVHSAEAAATAEREGADYVVFGSVFASGSHRGRPPAGLDALRDVVAAVRIPVLAIGGVDGARAAACLEAGAAGFAAIGWFAR
ncbi:MAG TPA: thiamine phosphate synthase [Candidatus Dormibacteraeota bacterium]|nr:thiamine phosphate synthase [Candidatus Dormibacteraeota bacterium]